MAPLNRLDVTQIEPRLKHPTIFQYFDALDRGEAFVIDNDHDPKPLYYELLGERGNIFTWEYLEQGPQWWRVRITKRDQSKNGDTIGEIAAKDIKKAQLLKEKGIDFSCGGHKTVKEVATEIDSSEEDLKAALEQSNAGLSFPPSHDYNKWDLDFLMDYIVESHHRYVRENSIILTDLIKKVNERHGDQHPELKKLTYAANLFFNDLKIHMEKEESLLFPAIRAVYTGDSPAGELELKPGDIESAVCMLEKEHLLIMEDLNYFRNLTNQYTLPDEACNSWTYLYHLMVEFEDDWKYHLHIENNILFSKALELEAPLAEK